MGPLAEAQQVPLPLQVTPQTESRLLEHLSKTGKLSDTLLVETELTRVRQEIEELEGKVRFMAHRIAYSTLNLTFKETAHAQPITPPDSYSMGQVSSEAARSLVGCLQSLTSAAIWVSIWGVLWVPIVLLAWYLYRRRKAHHSVPQMRAS